MVANPTFQHFINVYIISKQASFVRAEERILDLLRKVKWNGILQSEISRILDLSKSTVSEILSDFEARKAVVRKKISARSYRVWLSEYLPAPAPGILRLGILKSSEYAYLVKAAFENGVLVTVFNDPIDLTRALSQGRVDLAASPLLTQLMMGVLMKNFRIVRIVAKNGSGVVFSNSKNGIFGTTEMSTMDRNLRKFLSAREFRIHYFNSPESMIKSLKEGEIEGLAIWEPYLTILEEEGFEVRRFDETIGEFICCSVALNKESLRLNANEMVDFLRVYDEGCGGELKGKEINLIARKIGFDRELFEKSMASYIFCPKICGDEIEDYLKDSGINLSRESLEAIINLSFPSE